MDEKRMVVCDFFGSDPHIQNENCENPRPAPSSPKDSPSEVVNLDAVPDPTMPEEAADRAVGYCRHVKADGPHHYACSNCIAYWMRRLVEWPEAAMKVLGEMLREPTPASPQGDAAGEREALRVLVEAIARCGCDNDQHAHYCHEARDAAKAALAAAPLPAQFGPAIFSRFVQPRMQAVIATLDDLGERYGASVWDDMEEDDLAALLDAPRNLREAVEAWVQAATPDRPTPALDALRGLARAWRKGSDRGDTGDSITLERCADALEDLIDTATPAQPTPAREERCDLGRRLGVACGAPAAYRDPRAGRFYCARHGDPTTMGDEPLAPATPAQPTPTEKPAHVVARENAEALLATFDAESQKKLIEAYPAIFAPKAPSPATPAQPTEEARRDAESILREWLAWWDADPYDADPLAAKTRAFLDGKQPAPTEEVRRWRERIDAAAGAFAQILSVANPTIINARQTSRLDLVREIATDARAALKGE